MNKTAIIIPSRLKAERFPNKPLKLINKKEMILHVYDAAKNSKAGDVYVATPDQEIAQLVTKYGGSAIITSNEHQTGTDRIYEVIKKLNRTDVELVMNLQGDEPLINPEDIRNLNKQMIHSGYDLGTLASKINHEEILKKDDIVKVITDQSLDSSQFPLALNFLRKSEKIIKNIYHHLGIYCYDLETLKKFVSLKQSSNEIKNKLEQLRALDNNIEINVALAKFSPIGVDTEEDFVAIKKIMEYKSK